MTSRWRPRRARHRVPEDSCGSAKLIARRQARAHSALTQTSTSGKDRSGRRFIPGTSTRDRVLGGITPGARHPRTSSLVRSQVPDLRTFRAVAAKALCSGRDATNRGCDTGLDGAKVSRLRDRSAIAGSELAHTATGRSGLDVRPVRGGRLRHSSRGECLSGKAYRGNPVRRTRSSKRGSARRGSKPGRIRTPGLNRSSWPFSSQFIA